MLDVHAPHDSAHTWTDFFIHIATIVVGLIIAIGLEQTVEMIHRHRKSVAAQQSLHDQSIANRALTQHDLNVIAECRSLIRKNMDALDTARGQSTLSVASFTPFLASTYTPSPENNAWLALRDTGGLELLPPKLAQAYGKVDYMRSIAASSNELIITRRQDVQAILHLHNSPAQLTSEEREQLLIAFSKLDQAMVEMRNALLIFSGGNELALAGAEISPASEAPIFRQLPQQ
ncbi:MAG TPA: hypothetical protein VGU25_06745 [Acidobacteriaceae bacterium]|nr:hypothetical protein [Acidobacteriaceae bacterium]